MQIQKHQHKHLSLRIIAAYISRKINGKEAMISMTNILPKKMIPMATMLIRMRQVMFLVIHLVILTVKHISRKIN